MCRYRSTLIWDLDGTAIETQFLYTEAHTSFSTLMEARFRVPYQEAWDTLVRTNMEWATLKGFGDHHYFPEMMVLAAERCLVAQGYFPPEDLERQDREEIRAMGYKIFRSKGTVNPDAHAVMQSLSETYEQVIYTMGDRHVQWKRIRDAKLDDLFWGRNKVNIVPIKTTQRLKNLLDDLGVNPSETWMIGDSYKSDILPALEVGVRPIWIKTGNQWAYDRVELPQGAQVWEIHALGEIPGILSGAQGSRLQEVLV